MQSIPGTTTPDGYPSSQKQPKPRPCAVVSCEEMALPGKSWCQAHTDLFLDIGRPAVPPEPPRPPSYLQNVLRKPGKEPPAAVPATVEGAPLPFDSLDEAGLAAPRRRVFIIGWMEV